MRLRIGEFAKVALVSVSALRYYNDVALLKPAEIDRWTGYRYYTLDQLLALNRILALKDLGLSLEQIKQLLGEELPAEQIRGMLRLKQAELQGQARELTEKLQRVEARLQQLEMEGKMPDYEVIMKKVEPIRCAVLRDTIPDMESTNQTFNRLFDEALGFVSKNGASVDGPSFDLWFDDPEKQPNDLRVAVVVPTNSDLPGNSRITVETLPGSEQAASVVHHGPFATLGQAYGALMGWVADNGYTISGPNREIYLQYDRNGDQNDYITEIQCPVEKV